MFFSARSTVRRPLQTLGLAVLLATSAFTSSGAGAKTPWFAADTPEAVVQSDKLPKEAIATLALIHQGGPFPYSKDGVVFGNRERLLPARAGGYYREYTVKTAGRRNRGARRIVCGGRQPAAPEACFYTPDHYASFSRIVQ